MSHGYPFSPLQRKLASALLEGARTNGGATVSPFAESSPTDGYMVGVAGYGATLPLATATLEDVAAWVRDTRPHVATPRAFFGSWVDGDTLYLDVSQRFADCGVALIVAAQRDELAIWDVANGAEIRTDGSN